MERFVGTEVGGSRWEQFVPISGLMHQVKAVKFDDGLPQGLLLVERAVPRPQNDLDGSAVYVAGGVLDRAPEERTEGALHDVRLLLLYHFGSAHQIRLHVRIWRGDMQASVEIHHVDDVQLQLPFGHHEGQANAATNGRLTGRFRGHLPRP